MSADAVGTVILVGGSSPMRLVTETSRDVCPSAALQRAEAFTAVVDGLASATAKRATRHAAMGAAPRTLPADSNSVVERARGGRAGRPVSGGDREVGQDVAVGVGLDHLSPPWRRWRELAGAPGEARHAGEGEGVVAGSSAVGFDGRRDERTVATLLRRHRDREDAGDLPFARCLGEKHVHQEIRGLGCSPWPPIVKSIGTKICATCSPIIMTFRPEVSGSSCHVPS